MKMERQDVWWIRIYLKIEDSDILQDWSNAFLEFFFLFLFLFFFSWNDKDMSFPFPGLELKFFSLYVEEDSTKKNIF